MCINAPASLKSARCMYSGTGKVLLPGRMSVSQFVDMFRTLVPTVKELGAWTSFVCPHN